MEAALCDEMQELQSVYITLDLWSNRMMNSFLGMTVHFIDSEWCLRSRVLAVDSFEGRHTADRIAATYYEVASQFGLTGEKSRVRKIVSDSAANVVKAFNV